MVHGLALLVWSAHRDCMAIPFILYMHSMYMCILCEINWSTGIYMLCEWAGNITGGFTAIPIVDCDYSLNVIVAIGCYN